MLYEMIIMSSTSQLYCQTKMNLKKVICCQQITFLSFSAKKGHFLQGTLNVLLEVLMIKMYLGYSNKED